MCVYNFALTRWYNLKIKWSRDENFQTRIIQLKLLLSSDLLHLRPVTVRKTQKLIHSLGKKDRLTGIILITIICSPETLQRRPWNPLLFLPPAVALSSVTANEKKRKQKKRSHLGTFTRRRRLEQLRRRRRGCVFEEERRSLHDIGLCQSSGATSAGGEKKRNNRRISGVQNCTLCAWQKSLLDKLRTLWRETASHFLFPLKKKNEVQSYRFPLRLHFFPSSFWNSHFVGCPRFSWTYLGDSLIRCC